MNFSNNLNSRSNNLKKSRNKMYSKIIFSTVFVVVFAWYSTAVSIKDPKSSSTGDVVIHATTNVSVPSVDYIVDAVECLKTAYEVYDNDSQRAELYAQLYGVKHPLNGTNGWNVVVGYSTVYLQATYFVETSVVSGGKSLAKKEKDDKGKETLYFIFSIE